MDPEKRRCSIGSRFHLDNSVGMQTTPFSPSAFYEELFFSRTVISSPPGSPICYSTLDHDVVKRGYLGKNERSQRRYFVLRKESHTGPRRLEWFVTEERFDTICAFVGKPALFGLNKQSVSKIASPKKGHTVALYTKDQTLLLIAQDQEEQEEWYRPIMRMIQEEREIMERRDLEDGCERLDEDDDGYCTLLPTAIFKEVWPITVMPRGLGHTKSLQGDARLCLSPSSLLLSRVGSGGELPPVSLPLLSVRRFGHAEGLFFLELGRSAPHGPGEIWMEVGDQVKMTRTHFLVVPAEDRHVAFRGRRHLLAPQGEPELAQHVHLMVLEAMRELRALPDFSRPQLAPQRSRTRGWEKTRPLKPNMLLRSPPEPAGSEWAPVSHSHTDMSVDRSLPVATGTEECAGGVSAVTEELRHVAANEASGWEDEEDMPGYMMMSPQRRHNSEDDYVPMGSPHTHTLQPASSSSPLQRTFSSYAVNQLNQSCVHTQPDWLFPELHQLEQEASELQALNLGDSQEASGETLPEQNVFASRPVKIDIDLSLFTPVLSTAEPTQTQSKAKRTSPARPAPDQPTIRRFWLSSCLPFCLQAKDKP